jgi:hypothetical protein
MDGIASSPTFVGNFVLFLAVRQLIVYLAWLSTAAFAGAGACWCYGYGAQAAWSKAEAARHAWREARGVESPAVDAVAVEAKRGIQEIELYLEEHSVILPRVEDDGRD